MTDLKSGMTNSTNATGMDGDGTRKTTGWDVPSPWEGLDGSYPTGATHEVLGHEVPLDVDEEMLTVLGSGLILDNYGEDPTEGEGIPPLPAEEVAGIVEVATVRNNQHEGSIRCSAVARAVSIARVWRHDHRSVCEMLLRKVLTASLPPVMEREAQRAAARMRRRLADQASWSLWEVASGECLCLDVVEDGDEKQTILVDGGPYALTAEGERRIGTDEGLMPMWALIAECDGVDPYDCEEFLKDITYDALVCDGLVCDPDDWDF